MCAICHSSPCLSRCPNHLRKEVYIGQCVICASTLTTENEAFADEDDNLFCSAECFKDYYGFKEVDYDRYEAASL